MRLVSILLLVAGCDLYVDSGPPASWTTCEPDGYHRCTRDGCTWLGPTCPGFACTASRDCAAGCYCATGTCVEAGFCATDADCANGLVCDPSRSSCEPMPPSCAGPVTCSDPPPACDEHEVPAIERGCYTGTCLALASCDVAPACPSLQHEDDCLAAAGCGASYLGLDCTKPDGSACHDGDSECTCTRYEFAACAAP